MGDSSISDKTAAEYIALNHFDVENLTWTQYGSQYKMTIPDEQWALVHSLDLNMFYDDGEGYLDLGLDNVYTFDNNGDLVAAFDYSQATISQHMKKLVRSGLVQTRKDDKKTLYFANIGRLQQYLTATRKFNTFQR